MGGFIEWSKVNGFFYLFIRDDAVETSIAEQYKSDRAGFEKTVKQWVKNYAKDK